MFFHPKNLKSETNNPWFNILLHTQSIVCATVDSQCLEYLGYMYNFGYGAQFFQYKNLGAVRPRLYNIGSYIISFASFPWVTLVCQVIGRYSLIFMSLYRYTTRSITDKKYFQNCYKTFFFFAEYIFVKKNDWITSLFITSQCCL